MNKLSLADREQKTVYAAVEALIPEADKEHVRLRCVKGPNDSSYGSKCMGIQLRAGHRSYGGNPPLRRVMIKFEKEPGEYGRTHSPHLDKDDLLAKIAEMVKLSKEHVEYEERSRVQREARESLEARLKKEMKVTTGWYDKDSKGRTSVDNFHAYQDEKNSVHVSVGLRLSIDGSPDEVRQVLDKLEQMGLVKKVD